MHKKWRSAAAGGEGHCTTVKSRTYFGALKRRPNKPCWLRRRGWKPRSEMKGSILGIVPPLAYLRQRYMHSTRRTHIRVLNQRSRQRRARAHTHTRSPCRRLDQRPGVQHRPCPPQTSRGPPRARRGRGARGTGSVRSGRRSCPSARPRHQGLCRPRDCCHRRQCSSWRRRRRPRKTRGSLRSCCRGGERRAGNEEARRLEPPMYASGWSQVCSRACTKDT